MKRLLKILLLCLALVVLLTGGLLLWAWKNQDLLANRILEEVNTQLKAEVRAGTPQLSWSQFPWIGVQLPNVYTPGTLEGVEDTLLSAAEVNLQVHIWQAIRGNIKLERVVIRHGILKPTRLANGAVNWDLFQTTGSGEGGGQSATTLEEVRLEDMHVVYREGHSLRLDAYAENAFLRGLITDTAAVGSVAFAGTLSRLFIHPSNMVNAAPLALDGSLDARFKGTYTGAFAGTLGKQDVDLNFAFNAAGYTLEVGHERLNLEQATTLLHTDLTATFLPWKPRGTGRVMVRVEQKRQKTETSIAFDLPAATLYIPAWKKEVQRNTTRGEWSPSRLNLTDFSGTLGQTQFSGGFFVENYSKPRYEARFKAQGRMEDLTHLPGLDTLGLSSGRFALEIQASQKLNGPLKNIRSFAGVEASGYLELKGTTLDMQDLLPLEDLNTKITIDDRNFVVEYLTCKRGRSDLYLSGTMQGGMDFLFLGKGYLHLNATVKSQLFQLEDWLSTETGAASTAGLLPAFLRLDLAIAADKFRYKKLEARQLKVDFHLLDQVINAQNISFLALGGSMTGSLKMAQEPGPVYPLSLQAAWINLDVKSLFFAFDNFGQSTLTSSHIEGKSTGSGGMSLYLDANRNPALSTLAATADLSLRDGRITNFEPLKKLGDYTSAQAVKDIRFQPVTTSLIIRNEAVVLPPTTLKNSALNLEMEGTYFFNNQVDYHFTMKMNELLNSRKKGRGEFDDFLEEKDNRTLATLFISMTGPIDNPVFKVDKKRMADQVKQSAKDEGKDILTIFEKKEETPPKRTTYQFEWEEENDTTGGG